MNKELLLEVADVIEQKKVHDRPHCLYMLSWFGFSGLDCGTYGCIAGTIALIKNPIVNSENIAADKDFPWQNSSIFTYAMKELNISRQQASHLFHGRPYKDMKHGNIACCLLDDIQKMRKFVPEALRWMVKNNEINWQKAFHSVID